ncbi:hypothetical protein [Actinoplanes subtropicus]|uniref:hypothetical protein n=1 Tax=Actinoplanes subtropicus TaxID=543632 RepID=UPI001FE1EA31|nr:hypothetical protein [Actinoplanes subtropicus]
MIEIREFAWSDYDDVLAVWASTGRDVVPRAELEAKLARDPELFLVAESAGAVAGVVLGTYDGRRGWIFRLGRAPVAPAGRHRHPAGRRSGVAPP